MDSGKLALVFAAVVAAVAAAVAIIVASRAADGDLLDLFGGDDDERPNWELLAQ